VRQLRLDERLLVGLRHRGYGEGARESRAPFLCLLRVEKLYACEAMTMNRALRTPSTRRSILLAATVFSLVLFGCREGSTDGAQVGSKPQFRLKTMDGRTLGPRDFPGKVVVVDFWATWCGPCQLQARILESLHRDLHGKGVQFLAANVGEDEATVKSFVQKKPFPYPVLLDPEDAISSTLGVYALPTLMIIDKKGKISYIQPGVADAPTLRQILRQAGAGV
jgi:thiol-disulfide isomerase/thioredoxin